jgi:hypothetical protein
LTWSYACDRTTAETTRHLADSPLFGSGSTSIDVLADWWFSFSPNVNRWYNYTIVAPMHGFSI